MSEKTLSENFAIHWLQEIVNKINKRNQSIITLSTGKTPSGHVHVGILREIIICDSLRRILEKEEKTVRTLLFFDSLDASKRFPAYINKEFQKKHLGKPFALIPCPFENCKCESFAHHFGNELTSSFSKFGIKNEVIWTHELYKKAEMLERIKISLENIDKIKGILKNYIMPTLDDEKKSQFIEMQKTWMPVMVICEKCNKLLHVEKDGSIKPNRAISYNMEQQTVLYECMACGQKGNISINSGSLKLNWRVDWPAKWSIYKTSCEPAGKDHSVKGGAYDTGMELCQELFNYHGPVKVPYEWLRLGDIDMKTSKGIVFTPKNYLEVADPELYRMLILRTNPMKHISLRLEEIPQYFAYFERMENIFFSIENAETEEEVNFFNYIYPLIKIDKIPKCKTNKIPVKLLIFLSQIQNITSLDRLYQKAQNYMELRNFENIIPINEFEQLLRRTEKWLEEVNKIINNQKNKKKKQEIINKIGIFSIPEKIDKDTLEQLNEKQIQGIKLLRNYLKDIDDLNSDSIKNKVFTTAREKLDISPRKMFSTFYQIILGKQNGPQLGQFLKMLDKEWLLDRLDI